MLSYLDDLYADFLAFWGIDIHRDTTLTGPEFFVLARRTFSYDGVMTGRAQAEDEHVRRETPAPQPQQQETPVRAGEKVVDLATFRAQFPAMVSHSTT